MYIVSVNCKCESTTLLGFSGKPQWQNPRMPCLSCLGLCLMLAQCFTKIACCFLFFWWNQIRFRARSQRIQAKWWILSPFDTAVEQHQNEQTQGSMSYRHKNKGCFYCQWCFLFVHLVSCSDIYLFIFYFVVASVYLHICLSFSLFYFVSRSILPQTKVQCKLFPIANG